MTSIVVSPHVRASTWLPPTAEELRQAPPSRHEQRIVERPRNIDTADVLARHAELVARGVTGVRAVLADEFGCSLATVRRVLVDGGAA